MDRSAVYALESRTNWQSVISVAIVSCLLKSGSGHAVAVNDGPASWRRVPPAARTCRHVSSLCDWFDTDA